MASKLVLFDLDGTIYLSGKVLPGAIELLGKLESEGINFGFMTNNSSENPEGYLKKLLNIGLPATTKNIMTSCEATVLMLKELNLGPDIFIFGTQKLISFLEQNGYRNTAENPSAVVVGFDLEFTYEKLTTATRLIDKGVPLVASHPDVVCPSAHGPIPDAGMTLAALKVGTGVEPLAIAGKPNRWVVEVAQEKYGVEKDEIIIVGDRLATDMLMAKNFNMRSVLVLSGVSNREDVEAVENKPDLVVDSVADLVDKYWFKSLGWM